MDRRSKFRKGLSSIYLLYYDSLCELLPSEWQPYYGFRTFFEQDELFAQGRSKAGKIVTNAKGGYSPHNYGCASDWTKWENGKPVWLPKESKEWEVYLQAIEKIGLRSGAEFGDYFHNELRISKPWSKVLPFYKQGGMDLALKQVGEWEVIA